MSEDPRIALSPMFIPTGAGYMGHMVCFPHFGPASPEERAQGLRGHGEANAVEWQQTKPRRIDATGVTFHYGAELPKTQYRLERAPFVAPAKNILDASGSKAISDPHRMANGRWLTDREFDWPHAPRADGSTISLREFRAVPQGQVYTPILVTTPPRDESTSSRTDSPASAWFALYNVDYPLLIGYVFSAADDPWLVEWRNQPRADSPAGTARGIEFGTSPFDEGLRRSVQRATMFGVPTYRWIASRQRLSTAFTILLKEIPQGFAGVQNVRVRDDDIVIVERGSGREHAVAAAAR